MNENDNENAQAEYVEGGSEERQELSYADAFQLATQLHRAQQYEQAQSLYRALIELEPADPNPQHFLGILLHQIGQSDEGIALIESSLQHDSAVGSWHNNHGNVLLDRRQVDLAADAYARCIAAEPANLEVLNNLAVVERHRGNFDEAVALFRKALEVEPTFLDARHNLASLYFARGATKEAMAESAIAMEQHPKSDKTRLLLGLVYGRLGQLDNAIRVFQDWLRDEPNSPQARHYLAACSGEAVPERAGTEYVEDLFDGFASSFDAKLESLNYCAPTLIADALAELDSSPQGDLNILDIGCGTGLCGPRLRPHASKLVGIDISQSMLQRAAARRVYNELIKDDIIAYLAANQEKFDVIVSADTLCYFGRLDEVFQGARKSLANDGSLIFTVEAHEQRDIDFKLHPHGRYSHHQQYVGRQLQLAGFSVSHFEMVTLRTEDGVPVSGLLVIAR